MLDVDELQNERSAYKWIRAPRHTLIHVIITRIIDATRRAVRHNNAAKQIRIL